MPLRQIRPSWEPSSGHLSLDRLDSRIVGWDEETSTVSSQSTDSTEDESPTTPEEGVVDHLPICRQVVPYFASADYEVWPFGFFTMGLQAVAKAQASSERPSMEVWPFPTHTHN